MPAEWVSCSRIVACVAVWALGGAPPSTPAAPAAAPAGAAPVPREIRDGKLFLDGRRVFLKVAVPLRNFADAGEVDALVRDLPLLQSKHYSAVKINCYWHHFDKDGDGAPDVPLTPLRGLIDAVAARGMSPCLSVETYAVGGGRVPPWFWARHDDARAIDSKGLPVRDTEYGTHAPVPSIFSPAYREASRRFIRELTDAVDHEKVLYFETSVEPQYIGNQSLDYGPHARAAYEAWLRNNRLEGPAWPTTFPAPAAFRKDPAWNRFRAESLADWVNGDAAAFREIAGKAAWVAVDYLETCGPDMLNRNGDSLTFLSHLKAVDIIQVNWHWRPNDRKPNDCPYDNLEKVMRQTGRRWAVMEHMTLNGSDYRPEDVPALLRHTLARGTGFGWEFVSVSPSTDNPFCLYRDDWSPKPLIAEVDEQAERWGREVEAPGGGERK